MTSLFVLSLCPVCLCGDLPAQAESVMATATIEQRTDAELVVQCLRGDRTAFEAQEELEEQQKLLAALERSLASLPEETRTLLDMKHRQGKTCDQIATELGRPTGTVKSLLSRAYKTLRARLSPSGEQNP